MAPLRQIGTNRAGQLGGGRGANLGVQGAAAVSAARVGSAPEQFYGDHKWNVKDLVAQDRSDVQHRVAMTALIIAPIGVFFAVLTAYETLCYYGRE
ncbi:hypothetical protein [Nocardia sp. NPDC004750]